MKNHWAAGTKGKRVGRKKIKRELCKGLPVSGHKEDVNQEEASKYENKSAVGLEWAG